MNKKKHDVRRERVRRERRAEISNLLRQLGLEETLQDCSIHELLLNSHFPKPTVELTETAIDLEYADELRACLETALSSAVFDCPGFELGTSIIRYFEIILPVVQIIRSATSPSTELKAKLEAAKARVQEIGDFNTGVLATLTLHKELEAAIVDYSRIDRRLFHLTVERGRNDHDKWHERFFLHAVAPDIKDFQTKSGVRRAYRCGQPNGLDGIDWVMWDRTLIGGNKNESPLPVYVQSHALDNLYERAGIGVVNLDPMLHDYMWSSLLKPKFAVNAETDGKLFVEYLIGSHKLGYLVAEHLVNMNVVLVETFLFLTMDKTPEGQLLQNRHRLRRADKEYLELDKFGTFLFSDVRDDSELVEILTECGCGHLFRFLKDPTMFSSRAG